MAKNEPRIGNFYATGIITLVSVFEVIEFLLVFLWGAGFIVNRILVPIKYFIVWFLFRLKGVNLTSFSGEKAKKRIITLATSFIIGMIPVLGLLPEFAIGIVIILILIRAEDTLGISVEEVTALAEGRVKKRSDKSESNTDSPKQEEGGRTKNRNASRNNVIPFPEQNPRERVYNRSRGQKPKEDLEGLKIAS